MPLRRPGAHPGATSLGTRCSPQDWGAGGARHEGGSAIQLDASLPAVALGAAAVCCAALLGGATGFGYALLSTPLLLLLGFRLEFVVTANLALAVLTRVSVVYRFRKDVDRRRAALLILGSVPGLYAGTRILTGVDRSLIRLATGLIVMLVTLLLARALDRSPAAPPPPRVPGVGHPLAAAVAGFLGGVLGTTTSLSGVPPVLLLARERAAARSFQADLATYFVVANTIALALLSTRGALVRQALFPAAALWLPGALLGNFAGVALGTRLPEPAFRWLTLAIAFTAGAVTALTA